MEGVQAGRGVLGVPEPASRGFVSSLAVGSTEISDVFSDHRRPDAPAISAKEQVAVITGGIQSGHLSRYQLGVDMHVPTANGRPGNFARTEDDPEFIVNNALAANVVPAWMQPFSSNFVDVARKIWLRVSHDNQNVLAPVLTGIIFFASCLAFYSRDLLWVFGLVPLATVLPPVENAVLPVPFFWNLLTWHFLDSKKIIFTIYPIYKMLCALEPVFGGVTLLYHLSLQLLVSSSLVWVTRLFQGDTLEPMYGTGALCTALCVFIAGQFNQTEMPLVRGRFLPARKLCLLALCFFTVLAICTPDVPELWLSYAQVIISWTYLRYFAAYPSGRRGDRNLKLHLLFPETWKPGLDAISALIFLGLLRLGFSVGVEDERDDDDLEYGAALQVDLYHGRADNFFRVVHGVAPDAGLHRPPINIGQSQGIPGGASSNYGDTFASSNNVSEGSQHVAPFSNPAAGGTSSSVATPAELAPIGKTAEAFISENLVGSQQTFELTAGDMKNSNYNIDAFLDKELDPSMDVEQYKIRREKALELLERM